MPAITAEGYQGIVTVLYVQRPPSSITPARTERSSIEGAFQPPPFREAFALPSALRLPEAIKLDSGVNFLSVSLKEKDFQSLCVKVRSTVRSSVSHWSPAAGLPKV